MLRFRFGTKKKIQAAGVVLRGRGPMDRLRLLKILYIADREALAERGVPIIGGRAVAMDHGPLHSDIYAMIKGEHDCEAYWSQFIANEGRHTVVLKKDPDRLELSPYEIGKLEDVAERMERFETWDVRDGTHEFEEWKNAHVPGTSRTISLEAILTAQGVPEEVIEAIVEEANSFVRLRNEFAVD